MSAILIFFFSHWFLSLFFHSFFLHRYASHQMYTTSKIWEKIFYFLTWLTQGSSYLVPRAYAVMHRMHHVYSDTEKDPHSPHFFKDIIDMMKHTARIYNNFLTGKDIPEKQFTREYLPVWASLDKIGNGWLSRLIFGLIYISFYIIFAPSAWWYLLLPVHFLMGPVQGAIVNWFGHKLGYSNFNNGDHSRNTTPWGIFLMGELFQNNHHHAKESANFAKKWYEFDLTFIVMKVLNATGIIKLKPAFVVNHSIEQQEAA
ncbi:MAG: fatty acid desaturase [Ferruginibacter sp.]